MPFEIEELATDANFDDHGYCLANPDVAAAVAAGAFDSAHRHFELFGKSEGRKLVMIRRLEESKRRKLDRIESIVQRDLPQTRLPLCLDYLTPELQAKYRIISTDNVSAHGYGEEVTNLIAKHEAGLILDCGAGKRSLYYENVVNLEIVDYVSTDVRAVGEELPFESDCFDAVVSVAVLEHVKDPFKCAKELSRVLRPGGDLFCSVPLLQPLHGYPHHYYNMTHQGLRNLFEDELEITRQCVPQSVLPLWSLNWILNSWVNGLTGDARDTFVGLRVEDLLRDPHEHLAKNYVQELAPEKNFELASATVLHAVKR